MLLVVIPAFAAFVVLAFIVCWLIWGLPKLIMQARRARRAALARRADRS
ncbi:hypothetical protein ACFVWR_15675 [Leifsonia sp. NPDC058292]